MSTRSAQHDSFAIEHHYAAPPARVFAAWSDAAAKRRWFVGPNGWREVERLVDFRVGGRERGTRMLLDRLEAALTAG